MYFEGLRVVELGGFGAFEGVIWKFWCCGRTCLPILGQLNPLMVLCVLLDFDYTKSISLSHPSIPQSINSLHDINLEKQKRNKTYERQIPRIAAAPSAPAPAISDTQTLASSQQS